MSTCDYGYMNAVEGFSYFFPAGRAVAVISRCIWLLLPKSLRCTRRPSIVLQTIFQRQHQKPQNQRHSSRLPSRRSPPDSSEHPEPHAKQPESAPISSSQQPNHAKKSGSCKRQLTCQTKTPIPSLRISLLIPMNSFSQLKSQSFSSLRPFTIL